MDTRAWVVVGVAIAVALVPALRLALRRRAHRARQRRAREGERGAEPLLRRAGYRIRGRQVCARMAYALDGEPVAARVRADYLVERGGRTWIAEVKTGREAPQLCTPATRRQLLEYAHAFEVDGVLLVDAERARVHEVALPVRRRAARGAIWLAVGVGIGWALSIAASR